MSRKGKSTKGKITSLKAEYAEDYKIFRPDGNMVAFSPNRFAIAFYTDELRPDKVLSSIPPDPSKMSVKRVIQSQIVFTPQQAKALANSLTQQVKEYEKNIRKIAEAPSEPGRPQFIA